MSTLLEEKGEFKCYQYSKVNVFCRERWIALVRNDQSAAKPPPCRCVLGEMKVLQFISSVKDNPRSVWSPHWDPNLQLPKPWLKKPIIGTTHMEGASAAGTLPPGPWTSLSWYCLNPWTCAHTCESSSLLHLYLFYFGKINFIHVS